jgi:hypothetical protein
MMTADGVWSGWHEQRGHAVVRRRRVAPDEQEAVAGIGQTVAEDDDLLRGTLGVWRCGHEGYADQKEPSHVKAAVQAC